MKYIANYNYRRCVLSRTNNSEEISLNLITEPPQKVFDTFDEAFDSLKKDAEKKLKKARKSLDEAHGYMSAVVGLQTKRDVHAK